MTEALQLDGLGSGADFSPCRRYRYALHRTWDATKPGVLFVGLNPSTADEHADDPTIRRCIGFARSWGYGGLVMCNLYAWRSTDPSGLFEQDDPVGPKNDACLADQAEQAGLVIAAWGAHGILADRATGVVESGLLGDFTVLGLTKDGHPRHPLYMRADCRPLDPTTLEVAYA